MSNRYHLVVETPNANLVAGMAWLQGTYTTRLDYRHAVPNRLVSLSDFPFTCHNGSPRRQLTVLIESGVLEGSARPL